MTEQLVPSPSIWPTDRPVKLRKLKWGGEGGGGRGGREREGERVGGREREGEGGGGREREGKGGRGRGRERKGGRGRERGGEGREREGGRGRGREGRVTRDATRACFQIPQVRTHTHQLCRSARASVTYRRTATTTHTLTHSITYSWVTHIRNSLVHIIRHCSIGCARAQVGENPNKQTRLAHFPKKFSLHAKKRRGQGKGAIFTV